MVEPVDERLLMRLVDGELSFEQRREVLMQLEREPDGWRRCAALFIEDQAFCAELSAGGRELHDDESIKAGGLYDDDDRAVESIPMFSQPPNRSTSTGVKWGSLTTIAASLVLAYVVGFSSHRLAIWDDGSPADVVEAGIAQSVPTNQTASAESPSPPSDLKSMLVRAKVDPDVWYVQDRDYWRRGSIISPDVQRALAAQGARVIQRRGLMPVQGADGRQFSIPYEDVEVVPVNYRSY